VTFFRTISRNLYWADYQALKWGSRTLADSTMVAVIFKTKLAGLMKFIQRSQILGEKFSDFMDDRLLEMRPSRLSFPLLERL
jgi:hypothetical protein